MAERVSDDEIQAGLVAEAMRRAEADGFTGCIRLAEYGAVYFHAGRTVLVELPGSPGVAALLYAAGYRGLDEVEAASEDATAVAQLVDGGPNEAKSTLWRLVWEQSVAALFELALAPAQPERIADVVHPLSGVSGFSVDELGDEVDARRAVWQRIAAQIPSTGVVFGMVDTLDGPERVVSAEEWRVLAQLDGRNTVADVIAATEVSAFRVCAVLYRLLLDQVIVEKQPPTDG